MKKFIATSLLTLLFSVTAWSQIPDPAYIPSEYQDTTVTDGTNTDRLRKWCCRYWMLTKKKKSNFNPNYISDLVILTLKVIFPTIRNTGIIGQSGFQIGLSANLSQYVDASILMEEGVVRVDGINQDELPTNFMSTINTIGITI